MAEELDLLYELGIILREIGIRLKDRAPLESSKSIFSQLGAKWDYASTKDVEKT